MKAVVKPLIEAVLGASVLNDRHGTPAAPDGPEGHRGTTVRQEPALMHARRRKMGQVRCWPASSENFRKLPGAERGFHPGGRQPADVANTRL
jgi:hypothetical protein